MQAASMRAAGGMDSDSALLHRIAVDYRYTLHPAMRARIEVGAAPKGR